MSALCLRAHGLSHGSRCMLHPLLIRIVGVLPNGHVFWGLRANMGFKFRVALQFVVSHHLFQAVAQWRPRRKECPGACRTGPSLHLGGLDPRQMSRLICCWFGEPFSQRRIYPLDDVYQLILLCPICDCCRRNRRLKNTRLGVVILDDTLPLQADRGLLGGSRKACSAILTGICSKRVFFSVMAASLVAACTVAACNRCGENL